MVQRRDINGPLPVHFFGRGKAFVASAIEAVKRPTVIFASSQQKAPLSAANGS
jgi:hypothetical protein